MSKLPEPTGYRLLIKPYIQPEKTKGGIILTDQTKEINRLGMVRAQVISMGPLAYKAPDRFGVEVEYEDGTYRVQVIPFCAVGDWVLIGKYNGTRFKVDGEEYRIIEDDTILALLPDPEAVDEI